MGWPIKRGTNPAQKTRSVASAGILRTTYMSTKKRGSTASVAGGLLCMSVASVAPAWLVWPIWLVWPNLSEGEFIQGEEKRGVAYLVRAESAHSTATWAAAHVNQLVTQ